MPKIVDPTCLRIGAALGCTVEIKVCTACSEITLGKNARLTDCGVTLQAVYSRVKQLWKDTNDPCSPCVAYAAFQFPFISITDEQYELINDWSLGTPGCDACVTKLLIRDGGWARVDSACIRQEEYMGLATLGTIDTTNGGTGSGACGIIPCGVVYCATCDTILRADPCGSWLVDGFVAGGDLIITNTEGCLNCTGCCPHTILTVTATVITVPCGIIANPCDPCTTGRFTQTGTGTAYFTQCTNILCCLADTTDINLVGAVNQAVRIATVIATELVTCAGDGPIAFAHVACAGDTITRCAGVWCMCIDFGAFAFPGFVTITGACIAANNGTFLVEGCCAAILTLNHGCVACSGETLTADAVDPNSITFVQETDNRNFFQIYLREEQKVYDFYDLIVCQNLTRGLVNKKFALPLSDSIDNKICCNDAVVNAIPCICNVTLNYFQVDQCKCISGCMFQYRTVINAACFANSCVYQFVQKELRAVGDICDRGGCTVDAAEITDVTLPAKACIAESDYWILNSAQDQRLYHVWYTITNCLACQSEPVIDLSTGIKVNVTCDTCNTCVATRTHAAIVTAVSGLTKNTHLLDFTASVCAAVVTITNSFNGRTTDASNATGTAAMPAGFSVAVTTQGDLASTIGETQTSLLNFVGCCLVTSTGVFICNVKCCCTNCVTHTCVCGTGRQFAFVATGTLTFNTNLVCDGGCPKFFMYYTTTVARGAQAATVTFNAGADTILITCGGSCDWTATPYFLVVDDVIDILCACSGGNNTSHRITTIGGACMCLLTVLSSPGICGCGAGDAITVATPTLVFGSTTATIVQDNAACGICGCICMAEITFNWDFDGNIQGGRVIACPPSASATAAVTVVAIGLCSGQYVATTSTIARTKTNNISIVAALERNFDDPC